MMHSGKDGDGSSRLSRVIDYLAMWSLLSLFKIFPLDGRSLGKAGRHMTPPTLLGHQ